MALSPKVARPRLILTDDALASLRDARASEPLGQLRDAGLGAAAALLDEPASTYQKEGRRLLATSREVLRRVTTLALAHRLTGDARHLRRAEAEMLAAAGFPDWNPSHFLDVAEMATGLALGLDWLHDDLDASARRTIEQAIIDHALRIGWQMIEADAERWPHATNNWGQVCPGGLALGALAVWEREPDLAERVVRWAIATVPQRAMTVYAPDGAYPEGASYWLYGTAYNLLLIDALETALGSSFGLADAPGFRASVDYIQAVTGPSLDAHNYADAFPSTPVEALLWFASRGDPPAAPAPMERWLSAYLAGRASRSRFLAVASVWATKLTDRPAAEPPLSWAGRGMTPVASHRSAWHAPSALWLSIKGGQANGPHGHADVGSFVLEADGVRWAIDLGAQAYHGLESRGIGLWDRAQDGQRWEIFRLGPWSHNVLLLNGKMPRVDGRGELVEHVAAGAEPRTQLDLSRVYADQARRVTRTGGLSDGRRVALLRDVVEGAVEPTSVRWAMTTRADVAIEGRTAVLTQDGQRLTVEVLAPADARLEVVDVSEPRAEWDEPNPGVRQLQVHTQVAAGASVEIVVRMRPGSADAAQP